MVRTFSTHYVLQKILIDHLSQQLAPDSPFQDDISVSADYCLSSDPMQVAVSDYPVAEEECMRDDIKTIYHPHSGLGSRIQRFQDYGTDHPLDNKSLVDKEPWRPFRSRLDFEVAELALATHMNNDEVNTLCSLIHHAANGIEKFTIQGSRDLNNLWQLAADKRTKVNPSLPLLSILNIFLVQQDDCINGV